MTKTEKIKVVIWESMRVSKEKNHRQIRLMDKTLIDTYIKRKIDIIDNISEDSKIYNGILEAAREAKEEIQTKQTNWWYAELLNRVISLPIELANKRLVEKEKASDETIEKMIKRNEEIYQAKIEELNKQKRDQSLQTIVYEKIGVTGEKLKKKKEEEKSMELSVEDFNFEDDETKLEYEEEDEEESEKEKNNEITGNDFNL